MRLKCNHIKNLLSDYLDDILPENQTVAISQHLGHCRACQRELETLRKTNQLLKFYIEKSPPDGYLQQLWANLEDEMKNRDNQISLQRLVTSLTLKFKGFTTGLLVRGEELKTTLREVYPRAKRRVRGQTLNSQWYKVLVQCAAVACFVLIGIFIDRTYIRPSHKVVSEFIRNSLYSTSAYHSVRSSPTPGAFANQQKRNDNRTPVGYQIKDIDLIKEEDREKIFNALPVLRGKVGAIDIDLHPVSFKDGILTLVANLSDNDIPKEQLLMANGQSRFNSMGYFGEMKQLPRSLDLPEVPKIGNNKRPKFESWLAKLLTDITLPTLSIADGFDMQATQPKASGIEKVATGRISD